MCICARVDMLGAKGHHSGSEVDNNTGKRWKQIKENGGRGGKAEHQLSLYRPFRSLPGRGQAQRPIFATDQAHAHAHAASV
jgi:hypothetical protein